MTPALSISGPTNAGADGDYTLIEDDGSATPGVADRQETALGFRWEQPADGTGRCAAVFTIAPPTGAGALMKRTLALEIVGVDPAGTTALTNAESDSLQLVGSSAGVRIELGAVDLREGLELRLRDVRMRPNPTRASVFDVLDQAEISYEVKTAVMATVGRLDGVALLSALHTMRLPGNLRGILTEIISASPGDSLPG